jgi:hypothetical protein
MKKIVNVISVNKIGIDIYTVTVILQSGQTSTLRFNDGKCIIAYNRVNLSEDDLRDYALTTHAMFELNNTLNERNLKSSYSIDVDTKSLVLTVNPHVINELAEIYNKSKITFDDNISLEKQFKGYCAFHGIKTTKVWVNDEGLYARIEGYTSQRKYFSQIYAGGTTVRLSWSDLANKKIVGGFIFTIQVIPTRLHILYPDGSLADIVSSYEALHKAQERILKDENIQTTYEVI